MPQGSAKLRASRVKSVSRSNIPRNSELHRDWAVIELAANGSRHVFERRRVDAGKVTLPWIERRRRPGDM
jgi:hypothetical protein